MFVYIDDERPVFVEQLTLDEARMVLARNTATTEGVQRGARRVSAEGDCRGRGPDRGAGI